MVEHAAKALRNFDRHGRRKGISIELRRDKETVRVLAESRSLLCCLENLISNAIKFSPWHSTITMDVCSNSRSGVFRIEDHGPGISAAETALLFRKFTRLSARPTGGEGSTGMGLHIVHELVGAMGGAVVYEPGENGGARFIIELPLAG